jgi:hypothetical protein
MSFPCGDPGAFHSVRVPAARPRTAAGSDPFFYHIEASKDSGKAVGRPQCRAMRVVTVLASACLSMFLLDATAQIAGY